jgi:DNA-damage-inducible protein J
MPQALLNIRMDEDLKRDFDQICQELGMNMTTAVTIFAKKITREKRIPFDVSVDPFYSEANLAQLRRALARVKAGHTIDKTMEELEAMVQDD